jgi:hypothetical protein
MPWLSHWWARSWEGRRAQFRRYGPRLYLFPAVLWLLWTWIITLVLAVFGLDSSTEQAGVAVTAVMVTGFVLGLAPLVIVGVLMNRTRNAPPFERRPSNLRLNLILLLALLVLIVLERAFGR